MKKLYDIFNLQSRIHRKLNPKWRCMSVLKSALDRLLLVVCDEVIVCCCARENEMLLCVWYVLHTVLSRVLGAALSNTHTHSHKQTLWVGQNEFLTTLVICTMKCRCDRATDQQFFSLCRQNVRACIFYRWRHDVSFVVVVQIMIHTTNTHAAMTMESNPNTNKLFFLFLSFFLSLNTANLEWLPTNFFSTIYSFTIKILLISTFSRALDVYRLLNWRDFGHKFFTLVYRKRFTW